MAGLIAIVPGEENAVSDQIVFHVATAVVPCRCRAVNTSAPAGVL